MNALKLVLLFAIAALLLAFVVDRWREPQQLGAVNKAVERLAEATRAQTEELRALRQELSRRPAITAPVAAGTATTTTPPAADAARDGNPKLGVNFLRPYDTSYYHPEWQGGTRRTFSTSPKGINPLIDNSAVGHDIQSLCNDSLCDNPAKAPEEWQESLATSVVISDDYKTYTFTLRPGVKWQRPVCVAKPEFAWLNKDVELTSADFKFALDLILDPAVECPQLRNYYEDIAGVETPDPRTLVVRWKTKVFTSLSATLGLSPLPRHIYGANRDGSPIPKDKLAVTFNRHWFDEFNGVCGVGAYRMEEYVQDKVARFRRNPDYWGVPGSHFDQVEWILDIKQPDPQLIAFKNGQVHAHGLSPLQYKAEVLDHHEPRFAALDPANPKAGRTGELGWERVKGLVFSYLGWNMRRPLFADKRVRQAMSLAFPKERIIRDVFMGLGLPANGSIHPDSQYCNKDLIPWAYDPALAKTLLADAGWKDSDGDGILDRKIDGKKTDFSFEIKYYANSPEWDNTLAIYKAALKELGISLAPKPYEFKELIRIYEDRDFDGVVGAWQMDFDIDFYQLWHSSQVDVQGGSNHCGLKNARIDELAVKLRNTFEVPARIAIAREIQAILHEEQPYTFFRSGEGIFTWQNIPPKGVPLEPGRWLEGVTKGLDELHPLKNRSPVFWHLRQ